MRVELIQSLFGEQCHTGYGLSKGDPLMHARARNLAAVVMEDSDQLHEIANTKRDSRKVL